MVEQPICHNCQIVLTTMFKALTAKINETHNAWNITFSFFPLFGIFVIHLASVNGKHRRDKCRQALNIDIMQFSSVQLKAVCWLVDIFYGIHLITWCLLHESAGIVVFVDLGIFFFSRNFWLLLLFSRILFLHRGLKKFNFFSTVCCSGLFLAFFDIFFFLHSFPLPSTFQVVVVAFA